jgi:TolA-binding protein
MQTLAAITLGFSLMQMVPKKEPEAPVEAKVQVNSGSTELKIARLWTRLDELEIKVKTQAEKIKLLEKGLMLGVIPEELLEGKLNLQIDQSEAIDLQPSSPNSPPPVATPPKPQENVPPYSELLTEAQAAFDSGRYGKAIALFDRIAAVYPDHIAEGQHLYWIGLSWFQLKEYLEATQTFGKLLNQYPNSKWLPRTHYYMAKIAIEKGQLRKALEELRFVVETYPASDIAEMASLEINLLKEKI